MNTITCPHCKNEIEIDKALEGQIEARGLAIASKKHEAQQKLIEIYQQKIKSKIAEVWGE